MTWNVETLNETVDEEIALWPADFRAALVRLVERIQAVGLERMREPHIKHLRGKLWEMRVSGRDGIGRAIYVTAVGRRVVIVHAFIKKTEKTPAAAMDLAERRIKEII